MLCASLAVGYHIATSHHANHRHDLNEFNPGLYVQCDSLVAGGFLNSLGKPSLYGAKAVEASRGLDLVLGVVTGYGGVSPLLMVSYRMKDGTRLSWIPTTPMNVGGLHLSQEF
jgi:hypothetical protein